MSCTWSAWILLQGDAVLAILCEDYTSAYADFHRMVASSAIGSSLPQIMIQADEQPNSGDHVGTCGTPVEH